MPALSTSWLRFVHVFVLTALATACVPHVGVEGAPCPCPSGYSCCPTLSACVSADDAKACPESQPPSSGEGCDADGDCQANETCHAWKNADGKLAGPQECRKACGEDRPCAEGERCQLVPHDGISLYDANLVRACVPEPSATEADACDCSECADTQIGRTYCEDGAVKGCFLAFNEACGVACAPVVVQDCQGFACMPLSEGAQCVSASDDGDACIAYPCSECEGDPGQSACDGARVVSCSRVSYPGALCSELCVPTSHPCPQGSTCSDENGPHCTP